MKRVLTRFSRTYYVRISVFYYDYEYEWYEKMQQRHVSRGIVMIASELIETPIETLVAMGVFPFFINNKWRFSAATNRAITRAVDGR